MLMANSDYYIQDTSNIEEKKLGAAKGLYQSGNYSGALKLYLDMINTSYSYKLYYEIGRCYYKLEDYTNAEKYFLHSVDLERVKNPSYSLLGNIYSKKQDVSTLIDIKVLPKSMTDGYGAWWHVGIASTSSKEAVNTAFKNKDENLRKARKF